MRMVAMLVVLAALPGTAAAQARESCTFEECALRLEHRLTGLRVVRGLHAEPVAISGPLGTALAPIVAGSDSAVALAVRSDEQRRAATILGVITLAAGAVSYWALADAVSGGGSEALYYGSVGVAIAGGLVGGWQRARSMDSLEQAIWWYNRDVAQRSVP